MNKTIFILFSLHFLFFLMLNLFIFVKFPKMIQTSYNVILQVQTYILFLVVYLCPLAKKEYIFSS